MYIYFLSFRTSKSCSVSSKTAMARSICRGGRYRFVAHTFVTFAQSLELHWRKNTPGCLSISHPKSKILVSTHEIWSLQFFFSSFIVSLPPSFSTSLTLSLPLFLFFLWLLYIMLWASWGEKQNRNSPQRCNTFPLNMKVFFLFNANMRHLMIKVRCLMN